MPYGTVAAYGGQSLARYAGRAGLMLAKKYAMNRGKDLVRKYGTQALQSGARQLFKRKASGTAAGPAAKKLRTAGRKNTYYGTSRHSLAQSYGKFKKNYRGPKKGVRGLNKLVPISTVEEVDNKAIISGIGRQQITQTKTILHKSNLVNTWNKIAKIYDASAGTWNNVPADGNGFSGFKLHVKQANVKTTLINQGPATVEVIMYALIHKQTTASSKSSINYWEQGVDAIDGNIASRFTITDLNNASSDPHMFPSMSKQFNQTYWVAGSKKLTLECGREHVQDFKFNLNRYVDMDYIKDFDKIKGITVEFMFITLGPLSDTGDLVTPGTISYGPSKIIVSHNYKLKCAVVSKTPRQWAPPVQFSTTGTYKVINDESGDTKTVTTSGNYA